MKSKRDSRRKQTAEVFTPKELVKEMLDKLPEDSWNENKTFLDNSCGNGNFLVEILKKKISLKHNPIKALSTIYGVDIMEDNIAECKLRLLDIIEPYIEDDGTEVINILNKNIVCADALTYNYKFE
jgi:type I restriction-modification system DNA methylase subunit